MQATIYKIGKTRKDGSALLYLAAYGRRSLWEHGPIGSFWFAKCSSETLPVQDAQACVEAIHSWLYTQGYISSNIVPTFCWHEKHTLVNWYRT